MVWQQHIWLQLMSFPSCLQGVSLQFAGMFVCIISSYPSHSCCSLYIVSLDLNDETKRNAHRIEAGSKAPASLSLKLFTNHFQRLRKYISKLSQFDLDEKILVKGVLAVKKGEEGLNDTINE